MKTKKEVIQQAYGEYWDQVKLIVDENGWFDMAYSQQVNNFDPLWNDSDRKSTKIRPKSLSGIENNNGWIKIESESDLPKESGYYDFQKYPLDKYIVNPVFWSKGATLIGWFIETYTHFQPIEKPKPPIY